ncbi:MAG: beta-galactosidase [Sedimentisphaerales bacterium]|nr:beta-galactosidase [Sedimentisphaerales bacterium]
MNGGCKRSRASTTAWIVIAMAAASGLAGGCSSGKMSLIAVAPSGEGFVEGKFKEPFVPFGTNYYDPNTGWAPKVWKEFDRERVTSHFKIMEGLGVNCARVFLAAATFQPDVNTISPDALSKLDTLVKIARAAHIRLILTGPDHWEGSPAYWKPDRFAGDTALRALDHFWQVVGKRYRGESAILAWDLLNEPAMPWFVEGWQARWNMWLQTKYTDREGLKTAWGEELGSDEQLGAIGVPENVAKEGNPRLLDWQLFREHLADEWVRRQVEVLREADPTHLITVGYIQWSYPVVRPGEPSVYSAFNPHRQKQWFDFICVHFYPLMGQPFDSGEAWQKNLAYLQTVLAYCQTGLPVVLGEYGWYGGGSPQGRTLLDEDQQARWITAEIEASRRLARGWLSWPFADTPDSTDMSMYGGMVKQNMVPKRWGLRFQRFASALAVLPQPTPPLPAFDTTASLTAPVEDLPTMFDQHAARIEDTLRQAGPVPLIPVTGTTNAAPGE